MSPRHDSLERVHDGSFFCVPGLHLHLELSDHLVGYGLQLPLTDHKIDTSEDARHLLNVSECCYNSTVASMFDFSLEVTSFENKPITFRPNPTEFLRVSASNYCRPWVDQRSAEDNVVLCIHSWAAGV